MKTIIFVTGNANKFYEASKVCAQFDIELLQQKVDIDEIQHHDSIKITEAKVKLAYEKAGVPVVVNDSSWKIPALGGFPGGYMKDITSWLSTSDFMALMADKDDKSIFLNEVVAYYDGKSLHTFTHIRHGEFLNEPRGKSLPTFARLVRMDGDDCTIAEIFDKGDWNTDNPDDYKQWYDFAEWYHANEKSGAH